jgi:transcriptional regulator with XRE-family HTH domain
MAEMVGQRLARMRAAAGLSQRALAGRLNVAPSTLARYETGETQLNADALPLVAEVLKRHPAEFFLGEGEYVAQGEPTLPEFEAEFAAAYAELVAELRRHPPERIRTALAVLEWMAQRDEGAER